MHVCFCSKNTKGFFCFNFKKSSAKEAINKFKVFGIIMLFCKNEMLRKKILKAMFLK